MEPVYAAIIIVAVIIAAAFFVASSPSASTSTSTPALSTALGNLSTQTFQQSISINVTTSPVLQANTTSSSNSFAGSSFAVPPNSTTIGNYLVSIADVSVQSNESIFAGHYNITLYIAYSGDGSGNFFDDTSLQVVTNASDVIGIGTSFGGGNLSNGEHTYLIIYPNIPAGQIPEELQITEEGLFGIGSSTVTLDIPLAPYSTPII